MSLLTNNKEVFLITNGKHWHGISLFKLLLNKEKYDIKYVKHIPVNLGKMTISTSYHNRYIIMAGNHSIYIYNKNILDKNNIDHPLFSFTLNIKQQAKNQWIQGITKYENRIYVLTGDNKIINNKLLYIYDAYGNILEKHILNFGKKKAIENGNKWEYEGLAIKDRILYTTVMTGYNGKNIKYLFKILKIED